MLLTVQTKKSNRSHKKLHKMEKTNSLQINKYFVGQTLELEIEAHIRQPEPEFISLETLEPDLSDDNFSESVLTKRKQCCVCGNFLCQLIPFPDKITDYCRYLQWQIKLQIRYPENKHICIFHFAKKDLHKENDTVLLKKSAMPTVKLPPPDTFSSSDEKLYFENLRKLLETRVKSRKNSIKSSQCKMEVTNNPIGCIQANTKVQVPILKKISKEEFFQKMQMLQKSTIYLDDNFGEPPKKISKSQESIMQLKMEPDLTTTCKTENERILPTKSKTLIHHKGSQTNIELKFDRLRAKKLIDMIKTPAELKCWTGIDSFANLEKLIIEFNKRESNNQMPYAMERTDRILATLIRIHLNLPIRCIAMLFNIRVKYLKKMLFPNFLQIISIIECIEIGINNCLPTISDFKAKLEQEFVDELADDDNNDVTNVYSTS